MSKMEKFMKMANVVVTTVELVMAVSAVANAVAAFKEPIALALPEENN